MVPLFIAAYAILCWFRSPETLLNSLVNGGIQGLLKAFECFSSTFQGKFYFQGLFKTVLYIQVLFKPVRTLKREDSIPDLKCGIEVSQQNYTPSRRQSETNSSEWLIKNLFKITQTMF